MSAAVSTSPQPTEAKDDIRVAHRQHWGWWVLVAFVALCLAGLVKMLVTNENLQWDVVADYFFSTLM